MTSRGQLENFPGKTFHVYIASMTAKAANISKFIMVSSVSTLSFACMRRWTIKTWVNFVERDAEKQYQEEHLNSVAHYNLLGSEINELKVLLQQRTCTGAPGPTDYMHFRNLTSIRTSFVPTALQLVAWPPCSELAGETLYQIIKDRMSTNPLSLIHRMALVQRIQEARRRRNDHHGRFRNCQYGSVLTQLCSAGRNMRVSVSASKIENWMQWEPRECTPSLSWTNILTP